jgi:hypothetical protein
LKKIHDKFHVFASPILNFIGVDKKIGTALIARVISMISAPVGSFITVWKLSAEQQGIYYLFGSLLALRALFELGVGMSVVQVAAYARKPSSGAGTEPLDGAFVAVVNQWMGKASLYYAVLTGLGGVAFLCYQNHGDTQTLSAWCIYILIAAFQFASEGRWGLTEGAGFVTEANLLRIRNNLIQTGSLWVALLSGAGLFSFCIASAIGFTCQEYQFRKFHPWLYATAKDQLADRLSHYKSELVMLVRKASQTYLTGYFVFQIQQPICFALLGAAASARLGFTQSIGSMFIGIASIWLSMNFPRIAHHVADKEISQASALFRVKWIQVCVFAILAGLFSWGITILLAYLPKFQDRLMDPLSTCILYVSITLQTIALGLTYWPRAFKVEPFVWIAYTQMVLTPLFLWYAMSNMGLVGAAVGNLTSWVIGAVGIYSIFVRYWKRGIRSTQN